MNSIYFKKYIYFAHKMNDDDVVHLVKIYFLSQNCNNVHLGVRYRCCCYSD